MVSLTKKNRGSAIILGVVAISMVSFVMMFSTLRGLSQTKQFARQLATQNRFKLITDPLISKIINDLQVAAKFPNAVGLRNPPTCSSGCTTTAPACASKDASNVYLKVSLENFDHIGDDPAYTETYDLIMSVKKIGII